MADTSDESAKKEVKAVLNPIVGGGPLGLGDPEDKTLRKVEESIMVPMKMKEKAKKEKCFKEMDLFGKCAKESGLLIPFKCRSAAKTLEKCLVSWYENEEFKKQCLDEYLEERTFYRSTGIKKKMRRKDANL